MARFLLIGGLAIFAVALIAAAISVAAPYLALLLVIYLVIRFGGLDEDEEETPS